MYTLVTQSDWHVLCGPKAADSGYGADVKHERDRVALVLVNFHLKWRVLYIPISISSA